MRRGGAGAVLVLNAGSSSLKAAVFDTRLLKLAAASVAEIGGAGHAGALSRVLERLARKGFTISAFAAAGHRVVHGGAALTSPARLDAAARAEIAALGSLAPLHNPPALAVIEALAALTPGLPQTASFDTAFHATNPEVARRFALPDRAETAGLRRYGFHGLSYAGLVAALPGLSGAPLPRRLLACHLGAGASLCAVLEGRSVATTMGYSPLDGLTMAGRAGALDPEAVLTLAERMGVPAARALLNGGAGLRGLAGGGDMRSLLADPSPEAVFAVEHFCYWAARHAGSMIAAMGGIDAIAFTGGIGENAPGIRARIAARLGWAGLTLDPAANEAGVPRLHAEETAVAAFIVPAEEERTIAADTLRLLDPR